MKPLEQKVQEYLDSVTPKHSATWRNEMVRRIEALKSNFPEQHIRPTYRDLYNAMFTEAINNLQKRFPGYDRQRIEDIVIQALVKWDKEFDGNKGIEEHYLNMICIPVFLSKDFVEENPSFGKEYAISDEGDPIFDKKMNVKKKTIRTTIIKTDFSESNTSGIENDEEVENKKSLENDNEKALRKSDEEISSTETGSRHFDNESNNFKSLSRERRIINAGYYDDLRLKKEKDIGNDEAKGKRDDSKIRITAKEIIYNHYLLKEVAGYYGNNTISEYQQAFLPTKDFIFSIAKRGDKNISLWNGFFTSTEYFKNRVGTFKTASERQFMELCINLLRKGIKEFEKEIEQGHFTKSDKNTTPILSAVAIDKTGQIIKYCHKGQVVSINPQGERRSFQKHCEYTLFTEIITSENENDRLNGGTLFVTLEPCNKRTFYCKNPNCNRECKHEEVEVKIPCAVRCLQSGISKIYIGSYDTNAKVRTKGEEILKSGCYTFYLKEGNFYSDENDTKKIAKDIRSQELLEQDFITKGYSLVESTEDKRVYRINGGIVVDYFPPDLIEEICELNGWFLAHYEPKSYH